MQVSKGLSTLAIAVMTNKQMECSEPHAQHSRPCQSTAPTSTPKEHIGRPLHQLCVTASALVACYPFKAVHAFAKHQAAEAGASAVLVMQSYTKRHHTRAGSHLCCTCVHRAGTHQAASTATASCQPHNSSTDVAHGRVLHTAGHCRTRTCMTQTCIIIMQDTRTQHATASTLRLLQRSHSVPPCTTSKGAATRAAWCCCSASSSVLKDSDTRPTHSCIQAQTLEV